MQTVPAKTIIARNYASQWFGTDYNMNIYRGCSHGCIYCDSRSDCYQIEDFDTVRCKKDALRIIERELSKKRIKGVIATGAMSDPYNPFEKQYQITRNALKLVDRYGFGIAIDTKSDLVVRDIDILRKIKRHSPAIVKITITSGEDTLSKKVEPHVAVSSLRFAAIKALSEAGLYCGILLMPVLPFIEDNEENILSIISQAKNNGAKFIYPAFGVTLRQNQRLYFYQKLDEEFPGFKEKYIETFGNAYQCNAPHADSLYKIFQQECEKVGILYKMQDIISGYKLPYEARQDTFFDRKNMQ